MEAQTVLKCPECSSSNIVKSGVRRSIQGENQRFSCKMCSKRFSEHTSLKVKDTNKESSQQNNPCKELELLAALDQNGVSAGIDSQTIKGQMLSYMFQMQKDGLQKTTILNNY
jgi:transcriptional regulator NrdR family protein